MICEMCGAKVHNAKFVKVEGAAIHVCQSCEKFATSEAVKTEKGEILMPSVAQRLASRQRRRTERDVYDHGEEKELVLDYPEKVKAGRRAQGLSQDELAKQINEKKSVIVKVEAGEIHPSDKLVRKLERALGTPLRAKMELGEGTERQAFSQGMTLGDFIKHED